MKKEAAEIEEILALSKGDVRAFDALYARYCKAVHNNILKLIDDRELATELVQDVFLSLWQNRFKIHVDRSLAGWLFVVSYNKSLNVIRKKLKNAISYVPNYPENICLEEDFNHQEEVFKKQMEILEEAIAVLPKRKREVYILYRHKGRTKEDVARELGISYQSVNDYLKQSKKAIRAFVSKQYPQMKNGRF